MANETAKAAAAATPKTAKAAAAATPDPSAQAGKATQASVEQAATTAVLAPAVHTPAASPEAKTKAPEAKVEPLEAFIRRTEVVHLKRDVVLVEVSHPQALSDSYPGTYGGIRLKKGPVGVRYSDGSTE